MRCASAYLFDGKLVIAPECQAKAGVWITSEPVQVVSPDHVEEVGQAITVALSGSTQGVPHARDWSAVWRPVLLMAGARNNAAFMRSAKHVGIELRDGALTLTPSRNLGSKGGFEPIEAARTAAQIGDAELGVSLARALAQAE